MSNSRQRSLVKPLEPSSCAACLPGPNALMPASREIVDDAGDQRRLGADHDQLDRVLLAELDHGGVVGNIERDAFGLARDAGIARRAPQLGHQRRGRDLPGEGMFAAAGTEQEDVHGMQPDASAVCKRIIRTALARRSCSGDAASSRDERSRITRHVPLAARDDLLQGRDMAGKGAAAGRARGHRGLRLLADKGLVDPDIAGLGQASRYARRDCRRWRR